MVDDLSDDDRLRAGNLIVIQQTPRWFQKKALGNSTYGCEQNYYPKQGIPGSSIQGARFKIEAEVANKNRPGQI